MASPRAAHGNSRSRTSLTSYDKGYGCGLRSGDVGQHGAHRSWIERVAQRVTKQIEAEDGGADGQSGKDRSPRRMPELTQIAAVGDHRTPARRRWLNTEAEKRER